jgi:hypothetical protein
MTTRSLLPLQVNAPPVGIALPPSYRPDDVLIGPWSINAIGDELTGMAASNFAGAAPPVNGGRYYYPFELADSFLVSKLWVAWGATTASTTPNMAVYAEDGTWLIGPFGTAVTGANTLQEDNVTDTLLSPGRYWMCYNQVGATGTPLASATPVALLRAMGCCQDTGTGSPASTASFTAITGTFLALCGVAGRTQVA